MVAASAAHPLFAGPVSLRDLTHHRWVLQPPGAPTRDWLDHTFDRKRLPRPRVQVESTMLLMLPALIAETGLLSFISRHHLDAPDARSPLSGYLQGQSPTEYSYLCGNRSLASDHFLAL